MPFVYGVLLMWPRLCYMSNPCVANQLIMTLWSRNVEQGEKSMKVKMVKNPPHPPKWENEHKKKGQKHPSQPQENSTTTFELPHH